MSRQPQTGVLRGIVRIAIVATALAALLAGTMGGCVFLDLLNPRAADLLTRDAAFAKLKTEWLDPYGVDGTMIAVYGPAELLRRRDSVEPAFGEEFARPDARQIDAATWFFWIDLSPNARWAHPVAYAYVDAASGEIEIEGQVWYPRVNSRALHPTVDTAEPTFVFGLEGATSSTASAQRPLPPAQKLDPRMLGEAGTLCCSGYGGLVVSAHGTFETSADADELQAELAGRNYQLARVNPPESGRPGDHIADMLAKLDAAIATSAEADVPLCQFVFMYDGHGYQSTPLLIAPDDPQDGESWLLNGSRVAEKLAQINACEIVVIISACYSGNWIANDSSSGFVPKSRALAPCKRLVMITSSSATQATVGTRITGTFFADRLLEKMKAIPPGQALDFGSAEDFQVTEFDVPVPIAVGGAIGDFFAAVFTSKTLADIEYITKQSPQFAVYEPNPDCAPCCDAGTPFEPPPSVMLDRDRLEFTHYIGQSPCPQVIGTVRVTNNGTVSATLTVSSTTLTTSQVPSDGIPINPGESIDVIFVFTCAEPQSFTRINAIRLTTADGQSVEELVEIIGHVQ